MLVKLTREQISRIVSKDIEGITDDDKDEMAIPSYLHANPLIRWLMWRRHQLVHDLAALSRDMDVLEFGCGIGLFLPTLCKSARTVYAVDRFPQYAKCLADDFGLDVRFINVISDLPNESVDVVVAADVLEHITDLECYIDEFARKLRPGGRLIVSGPTESFIYQLGRIFAGFGDKGGYHHSNIDAIQKHIAARVFEVCRVRLLPFWIPPSLFKILEFTKA